MRRLDKHQKRHHAIFMGIRFIAAFLGVFVSVNAHAQSAATHEISAQIKISKNFQGHIVCSLYRDAKKYPSGKLPESDILKLPLNELNKDNIICNYKDLKPGKYAVAVFHDLNSNGKMDTNDLGFPIEPFGFSNNASNRTFGPPTFRDIQVSIGSASKKFTINLH